MVILRDILETIALRLPQAKNEPIKQHPLVKYVEQDSVLSLEKILNIKPENGLFIKASLGEGVWANVPWIAIFSSSVTMSMRGGYYPVYLFSKNSDILYLCMGQGVTNAKDEFKKNWKSILHNRAEIIRSRVPQYKNRFNSNRISLNGTTSLAKQYEEGPAFSKKYDTKNLPSNTTMMEDLTAILDLYNELIFAGGADFTDDDTAEKERSKKLTIEEKKQYRMHRVIEGRANTDKVKKYHGYMCQVCNFDFLEVYGDLGKNYIEAHHLIPYSQLKQGKSRSLNIERDFSVLCANCHRMIHRMESPADIQGLREIIKMHRAE